MNFRSTVIIQVESTLDSDHAVEVKDNQQNSEAGQSGGPESQDASDKVIFLYCDNADLKFVTCRTSMWSCNFGCPMDGLCQN